MKTVRSFIILSTVYHTTYRHQATSMVRFTGPSLKKKRTLQK